MKKLLKNKEVYERRCELSSVIPEFALIIESFEKGNGKCEECDEKTYALSLCNYLVSGSSYTSINCEYVLCQLLDSSSSSTS